jgi:hypothetical protein
MRAFIFCRKYVDSHIVLYVIFDKSIGRKPRKEMSNDSKKKTPAVQTQLYDSGVTVLKRRKCEYFEIADILR